MLLSSAVAACVVLASSSDRLPLAVFRVSIGEGVLTNLTRTGDEGTDLEPKNLSDLTLEVDYQIVSA